MKASYKMTNTDKLKEVAKIDYNLNQGEWGYTLTRSLV